MDKKKIIFLTDMALIPVFALTAYTGIELHVAGHGTDHQVWHDMAVFHSIAGFSFLILAAIHVKYHWAWYKALKSKGLKNKGKLVAAFAPQSRTRYRRFSIFTYIQTMGASAQGDGFDPAAVTEPYIQLI